MAFSHLTWAEKKKKKRGEKKKRKNASQNRVLHSSEETPQYRRNTIHQGINTELAFREPGPTSG